MCVCVCVCVLRAVGEQDAAKVYCVARLFAPGPERSRWNHAPEPNVHFSVTSVTDIYCFLLIRVIYTWSGIKPGSHAGYARVPRLLRNVDPVKRRTVETPYDISSVWLMGGLRLCQSTRSVGVTFIMTRVEIARCARVVVRKHVHAPSVFSARASLSICLENIHQVVASD